ncbi:hypothetical protein H8356DRAFT_1359172 [Neocallimastix lanati (nom. inval.)]|nr:hypothetical protein H8356DRAFT_1359172 [Neocallimastix sp. JGI-2020a]
MENGADVNCEDFNGNTLFKLFVGNENIDEDLIKYLVDISFLIGNWYKSFQKIFFNFGNINVINCKISKSNLFILIN